MQGPGGAPIAAPPPPAPPPAGVLDEMYRRWTLDVVVDLAYAVALDYSKRRLQYEDVRAQAGTLSSFRFRTGTDPAWPNADQRMTTFTPIFGPNDTKPGGDRTGRFQAGAAAVRNAAVAFSNRPPDEGAAVKREAFRAAANTLAGYLASVAGRASLAQANAETLPVFNEAQAVLTNVNVARAFNGLRPAAAANWPRGVPAGPVLDADGDALLEEISRRLKIPATAEMTQQKFSVAQRVAHYGALTISSLLANRHAPDVNTANIDALIGDAHNWAMAMQELGV